MLINITRTPVYQGFWLFITTLCVGERNVMYNLALHIDVKDEKDITCYIKH